MESGWLRKDLNRMQAVHRFRFLSGWGELSCPGLPVASVSVNVSLGKTLHVLSLLVVRGPGGSLTSVSLPQAVSV